MCLTTLHIKILYLCQAYLLFVDLKDVEPYFANVYIYKLSLEAVYYFIWIRNQSVFDWDIMSPLETCISILICISGYWFFIPQIKRKSTPNHVHAYLWVLYI